MPFIDFTTGQVLTADQMDLVMRQSVMRFADAATRDTALAEVLAEGMVCYLDDTNEVLKYDGTDWVAIDPETITAQGDIIVGDAGGDASRLALGTAGQILESDGTALSYVTPDPSSDDIITTQGDLIIGNVTGDAVRLPVGAADTVLTSDGTTLSFAAAGGGGGAGLTQITSGSFPTNVASFTVTGLEGFSSYFIRVGNVGARNLLGNGQTFIAQLNSGTTGFSHFFKVKRGAYAVTAGFASGGDIQFAQTQEGSSRISAIALVQNAGDNGKAIYTSQGSPSATQTNDRVIFGTGRLDKNNLPLTEIKFFFDLADIDIGEFEIFGG